MSFTLRIICSVVTIITAAHRSTIDDNSHPKEAQFVTDDELSTNSVLSNNGIFEMFCKCTLFSDGL